MGVGPLQPPGTAQADPCALPPSPPLPSFCAVPDYRQLYGRLAALKLPATSMDVVWLNGQYLRLAPDEAATQVRRMPHVASCMMCTGLHCIACCHCMAVVWLSGHCLRLAMD